MKKHLKFTAWLLGLGLFVTAGAAQADKVKFYIGYSNYDHQYQRHSYSYSYPGGYIIQYNYHPYYGVKHHKYKHKHHANCHHRSNGYYPGYKKHYGYDKHYRHKKLHDANHWGWRKHERYWHY